MQSSNTPRAAMARSYPSFNAVVLYVRRGLSEMQVSDKAKFDIVDIKSSMFNRTLYNVNNMSSNCYPEGIELTIKTPSGRLKSQIIVPSTVTDENDGRGIQLSPSAPKCINITNVEALKVRNSRYYGVQGTTWTFSTLANGVKIDPWLLWQSESVQENSKFIYIIANKDGSGPWTLAALSATAKARLLSKIETQSLPNEIFQQQLRRRSEVANALCQTLWPTSTVTRNEAQLKPRKASIEAGDRRMSQTNVRSNNK